MCMTRRGSMHRFLGGLPGCAGRSRYLQPLRFRRFAHACFRAITLNVTRAPSVVSSPAYFGGSVHHGGPAGKRSPRRFIHSPIREDLNAEQGRSGFQNDEVAERERLLTLTVTSPASPGSTDLSP